MLFPVNPWIRGFRHAPAAPVQLLCFPHAGGTAAFFRPMATALAAEADILAVQYPGRQDRFQERLVDSVAELADGIADAVVPILDRPTSFFGHSMGAALAYEVTLRLRERGHSLRALFVSGQNVPSANRDNGIHALPDDRLVAELLRLGATDPAILADPELLDVLLPTIRADYRAIETYRREADTPLNCPLVVLTGSEDPYVKPHEAAEWARLAEGDFSFHELPGDHFYLESQRERVCAVLRGRLAPRP
ncbi:MULTISPECIES: thioesterase II family protein [Streptomyces]|uniref:Thioesterase II family protein n=1 Tax=Streptomyces lienomycini TaxID=284035 RepID=A0ABV9WP44_9ACTN|nr:MULTISPECIES: alpha/beta fold hydrolase [Streptomyces]